MAYSKVLLDLLRERDRLMSRTNTNKHLADTINDYNNLIQKLLDYEDKLLDN